MNKVSLVLAGCAVVCWLTGNWIVAVAATGASVVANLNRGEGD